jgi:hypothetical protein
LVAKTPSVGVAVGGNQFMVGEGGGVSVAGISTGVTFIESNAAQDVKINVIARRARERGPRNEIRKRKNIMCV